MLLQQSSKKKKTKKNPPKSAAFEKKKSQYERVKTEKSQQALWRHCLRRQHLAAGTPSPHLAWTDC